MDSLSVTKNPLFFSKITSLSKYVEKNSITMVLPKKMIIIGKKDLDITKQILEALDKSVQKIDFDE